MVANAPSLLKSKFIQLVCPVIQQFLIVTDPEKLCLPSQNLESEWPALEKIQFSKVTLLELPLGNVTVSWIVESELNPLDILAEVEKIQDIYER